MTKARLTLIALAAVGLAVVAADRLFPLSLGAEGSCTIGGNLSTNAGGTGALAYGVARDLALGLGSALASKRGPESLRSWLLAAALVDCCDALAIAKNKSASTGLRAVTALVGGLSAGTEMLLARRLRR